MQNAAFGSSPPPTHLQSTIFKETEREFIVMLTRDYSSHDQARTPQTADAQGGRGGVGFSNSCYLGSQPKTTPHTSTGKGIGVGVRPYSTYIIETSMSGSGWAPTHKDTCSK